MKGHGHRVQYAPRRPSAPASRPAIDCCHGDLPILRRNDSRRRAVLSELRCRAGRPVRRVRRGAAGRCGLLPRVRAGGGGPARAGEERRLVTIVFADVTGSTELGERLDPERFREVMQAYAQAMREEIEAEGGTVEKFIGDAVMAAFGVPAAHEDDPARALRAGGRMLTRLRAVNDGLRTADGVELQIRIGINTGEVLATLDPAPGEAMVTGDAVNVAARLEAAAVPGQIVVAERTAASVRGFLFEDLGSLDLKGKAVRSAPTPWSRRSRTRRSEASPVCTHR